MANTYTTKLGLAKPANGDVDWHIPINENWDKIDTELDKALKISGTTIDTDKDWNGKEVTNIAIRDATYVGTSEYALVPSSHADVYTDPSTIYHNTDWATVKTVTVPSKRSGIVSVYYNATPTSSGRMVGRARVTVDGTPVAGSEIGVDALTGSVTSFVDVAVSPGTVIGLQLYSNGYSVTNNLFAVRAVTLPVYPDAMAW